MLYFWFVLNNSAPILDILSKSNWFKELVLSWFGPNKWKTGLVYNEVNLVICRKGLKNKEHLLKEYPLDAKDFQIIKLIAQLCLIISVAE